MVEDSKAPQSRDEVAELDRKAWNIPEPLSPVGPAREAWPVDEAETVASEPSPERPPAA